MSDPADKTSTPHTTGPPLDTAQSSPQASDSDPAFGVSLSAQEQPGAQVGRYKLLEKIGEGGFGVVYVAEQKTPFAAASR